MTRPPITILEACRDDDLFSAWFRDPATWSAWFTFLAVMFGLPIDGAGLELFRRCTARDVPSAGGYLEATLICGRRGGKSLVLALIAAFLAAFHDWRPYLQPGERAAIVVIAADKKQAATIFRYLRSMLSIPLLAAMITRETAEELELSNGVAIEVSTASFKTIRGRTVVAALCDELAFWTGDNSANPDTEVIAAIRPAMATIPRAMLLKASSPYRRHGVLWDDFKRYYGRDDASVLVWRADTRMMNPTVSQSYLDEEYLRDPASAAAEYGAEFRSDIEGFLSREAVEAVTVRDRRELKPSAGVQYIAFVDPSGGSADSMTLAIAHRDGDRAVLDAIRESKPPFSPEQVVEDFAKLLKSYRLSSVTGDRYAGEWPRERFAVHGIAYECSAKPKSDLYRDFLPEINSGAVELLDVPQLTSQLCALERRTTRGGRDSIDHPPNGHDDVANAVAGVMDCCRKPSVPGLLGFYAREIADLNKADEPAVEMMAPAGISHASLTGGAQMLIPEDRIIRVSKTDAAALEAGGWRRHANEEVACA